MTTEAVYSSAQVAKMLGVSGGMVRRYALALEELTKEEIPQHSRDGRQFAQTHVDALVSARRYVAGRQGMSVETGLRLALGIAELPAATLLPTVTDASDTVALEALKAALGEAAGPLLTQLQALVESNARLTEEVAALRQGYMEPPVLSDEVADMLRSVQSGLQAAQRDHAEVLELRARVIALEAEKARPLGVTPERTNRALTVRLKQPRPSAPPEDNETERLGAADGPLVRAAVSAARWLEGRLRGR